MINVFFFWWRWLRDMMDVDCSVYNQKEYLVYNRIKLMGCMRLIVIVVQNMLIYVMVLNCDESIGFVCKLLILSHMVWGTSHFYWRLFILEFWGCCLTIFLLIMIWWICLEIIWRWLWCVINLQKDDIMLHNMYFLLYLILTIVCGFM